MDKIRAYDERTMKKSTRAAALVMGAGLIIFGFWSSVRYSAVIGVLLILAVVFQKETYICREGIVLSYDFVIYKHKIIWNFDEISHIHIEHADSSTYVVLHFLRDVMTRRLVFCREEADRVLQLAKQANEHIHIEEIKN